MAGSPDNSKARRGAGTLCPGTVPPGHGGLGGDLVPGAGGGPFSLSALPVPVKREQVLEWPRLRAFCAHRGIPPSGPPITGTAGCVGVRGTLPPFPPAVGGWSGQPTVLPTPGTVLFLKTILLLNLVPDAPSLGFNLQTSSG